jgi:hypothetical protein
MSRFRDKREVVHALFWDSWWRGEATGGFLPDAVVKTSKTIFGDGSSDIGIGNKLSSGIFPDNNVFKMLGMRVYLAFQRCVGTSAMAGAIDDLLMMQQAQAECFFTLDMSQKQEFQTGAWAAPAGGGLYGDLGTTTRQMLNNGEPSPRDAMQFTKPLTVSPNQLFTFKCEESVVGNSSIITDVNALTAGIAICTVGVEGIFVRAAL